MAKGQTANHRSTGGDDARTMTAGNGEDNGAKENVQKKQKPKPIRRHRGWRHLCGHSSPPPRR